MGTQECIRKETDGPGDGAPAYRPRPVVLAIDDEPGVRESLQLILQDEFEVLEAPDGAAALAILGTRRVDVALLDVRMPGEPGSKVLPRILAIDESIPVILITADPHLRMAVDAMKAGAYDYLAKPWDVDEILSLVREAARAARDGARAALPARRVRPHPRLRPARGAPPEDGAALRDDRPGGPDSRDRARQRGERHRQGAGGARHPQPEPAARPALRGREPGRHSRHPARVRAVRPREGRLHRAPTRASSASSSSPTAARCSSTRSAACGWISRPSCCARSSSARSSGSAAPAPSRWTCA